jgi:4-aminobutyrate aminotransferase-like enzyme/Ser/Thr protein kinase RdoA (MazF antagonist)
MPSVVHKPEFSGDRASELLATHYGIQAATLAALPGERDQNFVVCSGKRERFVFKISAAAEGADVLVAQNEALLRVAQRCDFVPHLMPTVTGEWLGMAFDEERPYCVRLVNYLPGTPLAKLKYRSQSLLSDFGQKLAHLDNALVGFDHPALHRDFDWDLQQGLRVVARYADEIVDQDTRTHVQITRRKLADRLTDLLPTLRRSAIHNNANDCNVLVSAHRDRFGERHIAGIIDFGDMAWSYTIAELAVAIACLVMRENDSLDDACHVIHAYHDIHPLCDVELAALFDLMRLRVCVSVCMAAHQQKLRPEDEYLAISQAPMRQALPWLARMHPRFAECVFRDACGLPPHPHSIAIAGCLENALVHPVMGMSLTAKNTDVLDLSVGGELAGDYVRDDHTVADRSGITTPDSRSEQPQDDLAKLTERSPKPFAMGRYDEPRALYTSTLFTPGEHPIDPSRTIHLGLDVFASEGTPIYAPLPGRIACVQTNTGYLDYGTVVVLEHELQDDQQATHRFYSLYGHLSQDNAAKLAVDQTVRKGDAIGTLGAPDENGGWAPHVHIQLIVDDLGLDHPENEGTLGDFPGVAWANQREVWTSLSPSPAALLQLDDTRRTESTPARMHVLEHRESRTGSNLSIAYRTPLHIVRGWMQYLFDETGQRYLDAFNNVPHVGHCHPRVVAAAHAQMKTLNTNTRYLSALFNRYTRRLCATLPDGLDICYLLNSASEANELALRLARAATGRHAVIVQESAYHGHTTSLIEISPYKHDGPGGVGAPAWVHTIPVPDGYRGRFRGEDCGKQFSEHAQQRIREANAGRHRPAAFFAETCPSVAGQIMPPEEYLSSVYQTVRDAGALCIADEVQTGFGRLGDHFWGFERFGVTPDIVVMGKPIGNGHPIAAVVTTSEIATAFANGMEFFSTFGGNTVSCAVGLSVLDVIRDEQLQQRALRTGNQLRQGFQALQDSFAIIGDVRGAGLFWGLELVRSRETREPASAEAMLIANRLRDRGVLLGTEGPEHNVLKIRPPMPFGHADAALLLERLAAVLEEEFMDE